MLTLTLQLTVDNDGHQNECLRDVILLNGHLAATYYNSVDVTDMTIGQFKSLQH